MDKTYYNLIRRYENYVITQKTVYADGNSCTFDYAFYNNLEEAIDKLAQLCNEIHIASGASRH